MSQKLGNDIDRIVAEFIQHISNPWLLIDIERQLLYLIESAEIQQQFTISSSKYGVGCEQDSFKTPYGAHVIADYIGDSQPLGAVFSARQATGEVAEIIQTKQATEQDLILTRILRLQGLEPGLNCGPGIDSFERFIYIHGTHEEGLIGNPASHGCIRMANEDIVRLFAQVSQGMTNKHTFVYILANDKQALN